MISHTETLKQSRRLDVTLVRRPSERTLASGREKKVVEELTFVCFNRINHSLVRSKSLGMADAAHMNRLKPALTPELQVW